METETILHLALFSGILGFAVFCASYAFHVWRSRNSAASRQTARGCSIAWVTKWSVAAVAVGSLLMLAAAIWREAKPREGVLSGDGLYTVRADENLTLEYVTSARSVQTGDVLARFRSPERRAEIAELELKHQILETQRQIIALQPLVPDSELVRDYERHHTDQRQLLASLVNLIPDHALVVRERLRDALDKTERINSLNTRMEDARRELQQAVAKSTLARQHLTRIQSLSEDAAAAAVELNEKIADNLVWETEVVRLETCIANMEAEKTHLQESMPRFAACTSQQAEEIGGEITRVRRQLAAAGTELQASQERLTQDLQRAELLKKQLMQQIEFEVRQCQARLDGIHDVLEIKAPFSGMVAYADPAPCTALPLVPVVVLAPDQGFRFRLRMSEAEVKPLSRTVSVQLGLIAPILHRRFPGRLLKWDALKHEPGYVVAELACMPPPETIHDLVSHDWAAQDWRQMPSVKIRLLWNPPLSAVPLFRPAIALIGLGLVGLSTRLAMRRRRDLKPTPALADEVADEQALKMTSSPVSSDLITPMPTTSLLLDSGTIESGALGRNLQLLGQRLREAIKRQEADPKLLQAVEWAIDRHLMRAIQHLAVGMDHDPELPACLNRFLDRLSLEVGEDHGVAGITGEHGFYRVLRIVRTVAPCLLSGRYAVMALDDRRISRDPYMPTAGFAMSATPPFAKPTAEGASR